MTMDVAFRGKRLTLSEELLAYATRRLGFALDRFAPRISRVRVQLEDLNGPKGGPDKRCTLRVRGRRWTTVARATGSSEYEALDSAARRARRSVARAVGRLREERRGGTGAGARRRAARQLRRVHARRAA